MAILSGLISNALRNNTLKTTTNTTQNSLKKIQKKATITTKTEKIAKTKSYAKKTTTAQTAAKTTTQAASAPVTDATLIKWGNYIFQVSGSTIRGLKGLSITASTATEDKTADGEAFTARKNAGAAEISMTALLNAYLGIDVKKETQNALEMARNSATGYFYAKNEKLFPYQFMLVKANASNIIIGPDGTWIHAEIAMTLKQCTKYDGSTGAAATTSGGGGSSGGQKKQTLTTTQKKAVKKIAKTAAKGAAVGAKAAVSNTKKTLTAIGTAIKTATQTSLVAKAQSTSQSKVTAVKNAVKTTTPKVTKNKNVKMKK